MPVYSAMSGRVPQRRRLLSAAGLGVLSYVVPADLVDEVVGDGLAWEMRLRALPSRLGVYFVLGLCLFSGSSYREVLRKLMAGLESALAAAGWRTPAPTALTRVRRRAGEKPLACLFTRLCSPLSYGRDGFSLICGMLAVVWDGTTVAAAGTAANTAAFGKPEAGSYPQLRMVALLTCGTRALLGAAFGPLRGAGTGEQSLAWDLLDRLKPGMVLLADRGFYSFPLATAVLGTGAHLLWRVKSSLHLPVVQALPDGSWLTRLNDPRAVQARLGKNGKRRRRGSKRPPDTSPLPGAMIVRVIAFTVTVTAADGTRRTRQCTLITDLLDWRAYPAAGLAAGYSRRWTIETGYREFKTYLRGTGKLLRGRTPDLARQELWAYLVIYQAIRTIIVRAAARDGTDPARISFTTALHAVRRTIVTARTDMTAALDTAETEILRPDALVPEREHRICPRVANPPARSFPSRRNHTGPVSQHAGYTITITTPGQTTHPTVKQHKHHAQQQTNPP